MDFALLDKVVTEAAQIIKEPYVLGICGIGEPILHPDLVTALQIIKRVPFSLGTNGMFFDKERRYHVINAKFTDITLSLDAITPETHAKMRPGLKFETVMSNVHNFLDELRNRDKFWRNILIQFIPTSANIGELPAFISYWEDEIKDLEGVKIFIKPMYQWPGLDNPYYPGVSVSVNDNPKILWGPFHAEAKFRNECALFDNYVGIMSDGTYTPCCMVVEDEYKVGNLKDSTIMELYNSPKMNEYRTLQKEKRYDEMPFCSKCV